MSVPKVSSTSTLLGLRYRLEYIALRAATAIVPRLPLTVVRHVAAVMGTVAWMVDSRGRRTGMENLRVAMGAQYSISERQRILRGSYQIFARTFSELFWTPRLTPEKWDDYFILDAETEEAARLFFQGAHLTASAHLGNFEWSSAACALRGEKWMIIAQNLKNPLLTNIFTRVRTIGGRHTIIPQEGAMLRFYKHLRRGGRTAALIDLNVKPDGSATIIKTFGLKTSVSVLHCMLAERTGVPILPLLALPAPDGRLRIRIFAPFIVEPGTPYVVTAQRCWDLFEPIVREFPQCWLWMYKHWRYLPSDVPASEYPDYANRSKKFDRLASPPVGSR